MRVGLITGSGSYDWPALADATPRTVRTRHGDVDVTQGRSGAVELVHLSRHGPGHQRLSSQVTHRANLAALRDCGIDCLLSLTVCGTVDPAIAPGSLVVFDDRYFPSIRLPDGSLCSDFDSPGASGRGHWILGAPFSDGARQALLGAAAGVGLPVRDGGVYGHVDGPRFNTRSEIGALATAGVSAVSQTAGPEVVLAGEAQVPMALVGFVTDYANGVVDTPEPVAALLERMAASTAIFAALVEAALPLLAAAAARGELAAGGTMYRFDS